MTTASTEPNLCIGHASLNRIRSDIEMSGYPSSILSTLWYSISGRERFYDTVSEELRFEKVE